MSQLHRSLLKSPKGLGTVLEESTKQPSLSELSAEELNRSSTHKNNDPKVNDNDVWKQYEDFKRGFISRYYSVDDEVKIHSYYHPPPRPGAPVLVFLHGAGLLAMTFGKLSDSLKTDAGILLLDMRGHGNSSKTIDFLMNSLVSDLKSVMEQFEKELTLEINTKAPVHTPDAQQTKSNPIYFIGHSLGGSVMVNYLSSHSNSVSGLVLLDIVEEIAVKALLAMPLFIRRRPYLFANVNEAIQWHMDFLLYNEDLAKISIPDLFLRHENGTLTWKLDLLLTQPFWETWFTGLSDLFLSVKQQKLLILSTHETLDKSLIVGQMQGKYQLIAFNNNNRCGHFVQEDLPNHTAISISNFVKRIENPEIFAKSIGIVPKWGGKIHG